jgi:enediyne biosynthesis thioesterase
MTRAYEFRHVVAFEETNLLGNVYYVNHIRWQGRCRELFVKEHAPELLQEMANGLSAVTLRCTCEYFAELSAFDEIVVRMRLATVVQNRMTLLFEYWRRIGEREELVANGEQQVAWMRRDGDRLIATAVPPALEEALRMYSELPV